MKHYLLTWYGITDLRAALGLEATDGPILGALKTGRFSKAVVLAYTNPGKHPNDFTDEKRAQWEAWRIADLETRLNIPRDKAQQLVDTLSNTATGHAIFMNWLKAELSEKGKSCDIKIIPRSLAHLNDARGIYNAAASALELALSDPEEKTLTVFISPGTPVMAYTWALLARANPQHDIAVISSSDARKPPETIDLPKELLMPKLVTPPIAKPASFDVVIHLLGLERMPVYFGMMQFQANEHIFVTTQEFTPAAKVLARLIPKGSKHRIATISSPFRPADTRETIENLVHSFPHKTKISVNMTGGTKLMFAGALSACWHLGIEPFYFEIKHHDVIFIRDGSTIPFIGAKSVKDFFAVNGFDIVTNGHWEDKPCRETRLDVTRKLWERRRALGVLYQRDEFRKYDPRRGKKLDPPFKWKWGKSQASHAAFNDAGEALLALNGEEITVPKCDDFGQYLGGAWLEEYVFSLLRQLEQKGLIYDLRIGPEVDYARESRDSRGMPNGEFDGAFTDGKRLWLIECKAGNVRQEHIQKLENNLKNCGGIAAKGILVSSFPLLPAHLKRISKSTSIISVHPDKLSVETLLGIISTSAQPNESNDKQNENKW